MLFALVLLLLLIFLLQNGQPAEVSFFGAHGQLPMGVALLLAAVFGVLLVALPGTARIVQLRLLSRRRAAAGPRTALPPSPADEPADERTRR
ncbi:LapA family protein [Dactylosporangium sp. NPDC049140]|uniref:LapA family protein n=1 Tax=Dactylosporangium sp. NPDC049140 TaxID=3155647 RepID=UPI0033CC465D